MHKITTYLAKTAPIWFITLGTILMSTALLHRYLYNRALTLSNQLVSQYAQSNQTANRLPKPTHIFVKWRLDVPIDEAVAVNNNWTISPNHASWLSQSARPGEPGNIIIYGHNKRDILGNIRVFTGGEEIVLTLEDGSQKTYIVQSVTEVSPKNTQYLQPTNTEILTLYTCSGFLDQNRFIVRAIPRG